MKKIILLLLLNCSVIWSQKNEQFYRISPTEYISYQKPKISDLVNKMPQNFINISKDFVSKPYYEYGLTSVLATLVLLPADPWLIEESRNFASFLGLSPNHKHYFNIIPANFNSWLYFIGNGFNFIFISAGLASYGLITNDFRSQSTAMQLLESIALSGAFVQPIKRLTGRESPFVPLENGRRHSRWHFAPSFSQYQKHTPRYDAMPSGHLTTAMAALTILIENYPEYRWIQPIGYSLLGVMCFEMMQSKVHWASDYPIALFMGYLIGKNIAKSRIKRHGNSPDKPKYDVQFSAGSVEGFQTMGVTIRF